MASLESDVMQSFVLVCEVIKDKVMADVQEAARKGKVLSEDMSAADNLKRLDRIVRESVDQTARNSMRQMQSSLKSHAREIDRLRSDLRKR